MLEAHFVYEYQARKIFFQNSFHQQAPQCYDAFGVAFGGTDAFLRFQPSFSTARHTLVRLNAGPPAAASAAPTSGRVASDCWRS